ncbi:MAG: OsmC family protein [Flavobacteriaceae bacterium]|nr:OsmC family protein [Flavobacteriaceae bacterium]
MEITLTRNTAQFEFIATNNQAELPICAAPSLGATQNGFRPMELLLVGLASCMSIDVLNILYKQRQTITKYEVKVNATRKDGEPSLFDKITVSLYVWGKVNDIKIDKALKLTKEKYCSVYHILKPTAQINTQYFLNHED